MIVAKKLKPTLSGTVTFSAEVTLAGSADAGDMSIVINQTKSEEKPPMSPPTSPPTNPNPPGASDPPDYSKWSPPRYLRTDKDVVAIPNTPKPGYLADHKDPVFGTKVTRITGNPGTDIRNIPGAKWGDQARHHYSSDQAWNCDESLIYLDTNRGTGAAGPTGVFLDGETYEPMFAPQSKPSSSDVRWHHSDPELMMFAHRSILGTWNPKTGKQEIIKDFGSTYSEMTFGPWEGCFSDDGDFVVISCKKGGKEIAFAYKISQDSKGFDIDPADFGFGTLNACRISPKGTYMVWGLRPDVVVVTDLQGAVITTLPSNYVSHWDVITDTSPDEVLVGRVNSGSVGQGRSGLISKYRLRDGRRYPLSEGGWCSHTSSRSIHAHRWAVSDAMLEGATYPPYNGELIMCALTGSAVYRLCHTHTVKPLDYVAQTQPSHAPHPGRVIFASPWDVQGSAPRPVGCYVVDFRE
jgi:hypothetical protein